MHCDLKVCLADAADSACECPSLADCNPNARKRRAVEVDESVVYRVTIGPYYYKKVERDDKGKLVFMTSRLMLFCPHMVVHFSRAWDTKKLWIAFRDWNLRFSANSFSRRGHMPLPGILHIKHGWILSSRHSFFYFLIRSQRQETWSKRRQLFISTQFKRCHSFLSQWCHHSINYILYRVLHFARTSPAFFYHRVEQVTWSQCENVNALEPFPQTFYVIIWSINQLLENYYLGSIFVVFTATRIMHGQF